jgi:hypothetical protein
MNLDELQQMWAEHDKRLDQSLRLNVQLLREVHLGHARSVLSRLRWMIGFEFATDALLVLWLGSYAVDHLGELRFGVPGALLFLVWTGFLALSLRQLERAGRLDYGAPIAAMQRQLESLRILRTANTKWRLLLAPALWTPLVIVVLQAFFGVDAWKNPGAAWVLANALVGTALSPALFWFCRRYADRLQRLRFVQGIVSNVSGRCLARARERLDAIAEFEQETRPGAA